MRWTAIASCLWLGTLVGCGSSAPKTTGGEGQEVFANATMEEVADMYRSFSGDLKKPPTKVADFTRYEAAFSTGIMHLKDGRIVLFWGSPLSEGSSTVLAYEKHVPNEGGFVLLQDGKTIKKMTAEEFKSATKAGAVADAAGAKKA
jgi:hypothetical protein